MKYLNILISGILIFSLAGCGKKDEKTQEDWKKRNTSDYFIRLGKLVEKVDFHLRLGKDIEFSLVVMEEIDKIVTILAPDAKFKPHDENDSYEIMINSINAKINKIIAEEE